MVGWLKHAIFLCLFFLLLLILFLHTSELHVCGPVQVLVAYQRTWLTYKARVYSSSECLSWQGLDLSCEFCCWWITFASVEHVHFNALRVTFWSGKFAFLFPLACSSIGPNFAKHSRVCFHHLYRISLKLIGT